MGGIAINEITFTDEQEDAMNRVESWCDELGCEYWIVGHSAPKYDNDTPDMLVWVKRRSDPGTFLEEGVGVNIWVTADGELKADTVPINSPDDLRRVLP